MRYYCKIIKINDEEITVNIQNYEIVCFCNVGCNYNIGDNVICELVFYDDLEIKETTETEKIERIRSSYSYKVIGVLDVDNKMLKSNIDFSLDDLDVWNIAYLDKKKVEVVVSRIDIDFL